MSDDRDDHPPTGDDPFAATAGAYVLGALGPTDRDAYERHLRVCGACRSSVEDLAGLPGLLSRVPREVVDALEDDDRAALDAFGDGPAGLPGALTGAPSTGLPDTVLPRLLREVRRGRRRRRTVLATGLVGAVAATAVVVGVLTTTLGGDTAPPQAAPTADAPAPVESMQPLLPVPISATARLTQVAWGTQVEITCAYALEAAGEPYDYALVVKDRDGTSEQLGTWTAIPGRDASLSGATAWPLDRISAVEVQTLQGTAILRLEET